MLEEFKKFIMRGNVVDLAVGVIIGVAFGAIVTSLVNDIIMPPIGLLLGKVDFNNLFFSLDGKKYAALAELGEAGVSAFNLIVPDEEPLRAAYRRLIAVRVHRRAV